jgi:hypothetical protein
MALSAIVLIVFTIRYQMSYATLTKQWINIKHRWKILFSRIPSKNDICDQNENKLKSGEHILIISMTDVIGLRNIHIRVITKLPNSEQSYKGKVKTHKYINRQNQSTTGKLWKPYWPWFGTGISKEMVG